jgi:hypothetical protein
MPSSGNPYVNTSSASELVQYIKYRSTQFQLKHSITSYCTLNGVEGVNFCSVQSRRTSLRQDSARIWVTSWANGRRLTQHTRSSQNSHSIVFNIITFYEVMLSFNWNWYAPVLYTLDQFGGAVCVNMRIPWWWYAGCVEICREETVHRLCLRLVHE